MDRIIESPRSLRVDKKHIPTVKKARVDGGFGNQKALAEAIGCSQSTVGKFLRGRSVDQNIFIKICNKFGLNWEDIAQLQDDTPETSLESNQTVQEPQLDLHQLCLDVLKEQFGKQLFSRQVIERNLGNEYSGVYVPLGVVRPKLASDPEEHFSRDDFLKRIVKQGTNLAIVGNSGTGKSTWLEQIALHIAEEKIGFPICIPASALRGKTLKDYLLTDWLEEALPYLNPDAYQVSDIEKAKLRKLFGTGKVWLLVDAIDEMSLPPEYDSRVEAIAKNYDWHFFLRHVQESPSEGSYRIFDPKWWNIYVFWMGEPSVTSASKSALLRALVAFEDESEFNFYRWRTYCIAAEGLPEFKDCPPSLADEIVGTIVKLSTGVIVVEHQPLRLHHSIVESARTALFGTDANRAVDFIVSNLNLSSIVKNEHLQKDIAEILEKIGIGNSKAIQFSIQLLLENHDEETQKIWINCLGKIGVGDSNAIYALTQLFHQSSDQSTRSEIAQTLIKLEPSNECARAFFAEQNQAIQPLRNLQNCQDDSLVYQAAMKLQSINPDSPKAQDDINKLLNSKNDFIVLKAARKWLEIKANPYPLVKILLEIVGSSKDRYARKEAARILLKISADDQNVTKSIIELSYTRPDEETHRIVAWYLGEIIPASSEAIKVLISLLQKSSIDEGLRREVVESLGKIGFDNLNAIRALEKLVDESKDEKTCFLVACTLLQISTDKSKAIEALKKLMYSNTSQSSLFIQSQSAITLWQQLPGDINILEVLIRLLLDNQGNSDRIRFTINPGEGFVQETIANFLKTLVFTDQLPTIPTIINIIQSYVSRQDAVNISLYKPFADEIIWHYAQNLPYDKFYQACRGK